jgi:hypothetical protein
LAKLLFVFKVHIRKHTTRNFLPNLYGTWKEIAERIKEIYPQQPDSATHARVSPVPV